MDFFTYTSNWIKGEIFEGIIVTMSGVLILMSSLLFWKFGTTPNAKALVIPFMTIALILTVSGITLVTSNQKRLVQFEQSYQDNSQEFVKTEKQRVDDFQYMYTVTKILASIFFIFGISAFWLSKNNIIQAVAIALVFFGASGLIIDYFSKERADIYYEHITKEIKSHE